MKFKTRKHGIILILVFVFIFFSFKEFYFTTKIKNDPTIDYLQNITIESVEKSNNFSWESYAGTEGAEYFTKSAQKKYFGSAVDLNFIKNFQIISQGNIDKFLDINPKIPSTRFIANRKIEDKSKSSYYWNEIEYIFKFEDNKWLIDKINLINSGWR
ncbi:MAG: hypothetical protein GX434_08105 [Peptococcaceae bacterium]|nr:hypothetical protein [Peptococcaceae bacterium]